jgi:hypothetical protein
MKLKGSNANRLKPELKEKMEKTLKRMEKTREVREMQLQDKINEKLLWLKEQEKLGAETIQKLTKQIEGIQVQVHRIQGAIVVLNDLNKSEEKVIDVPEKKE